MKLLITLIMLTLPFLAFAQEGTVIVKQEQAITELLRRHTEISKAKPVIPGYRVQLRSFSGTNTRKEATDLKTDFLTNFPDVPAYLVFNSPNFQVRVGDFRNRFEAFKLLKEIKQAYPSAYIVRDEINLPKLGE